MYSIKTDTDDFKQFCWFLKVSKYIVHHILICMLFDFFVIALYQRNLVAPLLPKHSANFLNALPEEG